MKSIQFQGNPSIFKSLTKTQDKK